MKIRPLQSALNAGELSKRLRGRMDVARYTNGLEICRNALPLLSGGVSRRSGSRKVGTAAATDIKLIPFVAMIGGVLVSYVLEFTAGKIRFYSGTTKQQITDAGSPVEVVTPYLAADLDRLNAEVFEGALYLWHADHPPQKLSTAGAISWTLAAVALESIPFFRPENTSIITITPSALTGVVTLTASSALFVADHVGVKFKVNGGIFKVTAVTDSTHATATAVQRILVRNSLTQITETVHLDIDPATMTGPATLSVEVVTTRTSASANLLLETEQTLPDDEAGLTYSGTQIVDTSDAKEIYYDTIEVVIDDALLGGARSVDLVVISKIFDEFATSESTITFTVVSSITPASLPTGITSSTTQTQLSATGLEADSDWREESWSDVHGWPALGTFHKQRMITAATSSQPLTLWASKIGYPENFTAGTLDDEAFTYTLDTSNTGLSFLLPGEKIRIMADIELSLSGGTAPLAPLNIQVDHNTSHGCSRLAKPILIGKDMLYASLSGLAVRVSRYSLERDGIVAPEIGYLAAHLLEAGGGIVDMTFIAEPQPVAWIITATGTLLSLIIDQDQEVMAWAWHDGDSSPNYKSITSIPGPAGQTQVWFAVVRNGSALVEIFDTTLQTDSAATATATNTISGLDHLNGATVDIVADGFVLPQQVVAAGQVVLDAVYAVSEAGVHYESRIKDLPPYIEGGVNAKSKVNTCAVLLHETKTCKINGQEFTNRRFPDDILDTALAKFSGWHHVDICGDWSADGSSMQIDIVQDLPLPMTVLAIAKEVSVNA